MTAVPQHEPERGRPPFADASPAQVRAALVPEEAAEFDRQWHEVMARATQQLDLTEVHAVLDGWRRIAWITSANGPETHRRMLSSIDERLRTGERHPGAVPWEQIEVQLGLSE